MVVPLERTVSGNSRSGERCSQIRSRVMSRDGITLSAQDAAARELRIKADAEYFDKLEYDRSRYSEDVAVAARIFLIAVRNAIDTGSYDVDSSSADHAPQSNRTSQENLNTLRASGTNGASSGGGRSSGVDHRGGKNMTSGGPGGSGSLSVAVNSTGRGTKRPGAGQTGRNSAQKTKKTKRNHGPNGLGPASDIGNGNGNGNGNGIADSPSVSGKAAGNGNHSLSGNGASAAANATLLPRSEVACRVKEDGNTTWILAKVIRYVSEAKKYEVSDSGDDEGQKTHMVFKKHIRTLTKKASDFESGARCFAVYPDTTVFYPATVIGRRGRQVQCVFDDEDDDEDVPKEVDGRHVLPFL